MTPAWEISLSVRRHSGQEDLSLTVFADVGRLAVLFPERFPVEFPPIPSRLRHFHMHLDRPVPISTMRSFLLSSQHTLRTLHLTRVSPSSLAAPTSFLAASPFRHLTTLNLEHSDCSSHWPVLFATLPALAHLEIRGLDTHILAAVAVSTRPSLRSIAFTDAKLVDGRYFGLIGRMVQQRSLRGLRRLELPIRADAAQELRRECETRGIQVLFTL